MSVSRTNPKALTKSTLSDADQTAFNALLARTPNGLKPWEVTQIMRYLPQDIDTPPATPNAGTEGLYSYLAAKPAGTLTTAEASKLKKLKERKDYVQETTLAAAARGALGPVGHAMTGNRRYEIDEEATIAVSPATEFVKGGVRGALLSGIPGALATFFGIFAAAPVVVAVTGCSLSMAFGHYARANHESGGRFGKTLGAALLAVTTAVGGIYMTYKTATADSSIGESVKVSTTHDPQDHGRIRQQELRGSIGDSERLKATLRAQGRADEEIRRTTPPLTGLGARRIAP